MSFSRRDTASGRCERPKGVKNPCGFEPIGSKPQETLRIRSHRSGVLRWGDMKTLSSKLDTPGKSIILLLENFAVRLQSAA